METDSLRTVKMEYSWTEGTNNQDQMAKMYLPVCDDLLKKEWFFYIIGQFLDSMSNDHLHLSTGASCYSKFRMVVKGSLCLS